jgi:3-hydroxyacyl-[acyl-carrier-protein] dehydratase
MIIKDDNESIKTLSYKEIVDLIPHRYPFLLIDKVTDIIIGNSAKGIKFVTINESFFQGHFPNHPVMPGVLILEAMAQTAACLVSFADSTLSENSLVFFTGVEKAKFRKPVLPGCALELNIKISASKKTLYKFIGNACVNNVTVATSEFSAMLVHEDKAS